MRGVGSERQRSELKRPLRIKGLDLDVDDEDLAKVLGMVKARKKVRDEKQEKERTEKERKVKEEEEERHKKRDGEER